MENNFYNNKQSENREGLRKDFDADNQALK